jgi:hypothetical protein
MKKQEFTIFADYFQFYIQDEPADGDLSDAWDSVAESRLLAVAPGTVGIGTVRDMDVSVSVMFHNEEPIAAFDDCDHVVECSISVKSKRLVLAGCTDYFPEAARIKIAPGTYRVRVSYKGLNTISADGLDGNDSYCLDLWPAPTIEPTILKQRAV